MEVILRRLANDAMRSDPRAIKMLLLLVDRYAEVPGTEKQLRELMAEDAAILEHYLREPTDQTLDPTPTSDTGGGEADD
jgi:hypothetical protein